MIGIIEYSAGNTGSASQALTRLKIPNRIITSVDEVDSCTGLILPGAGAAPAAIPALKNKNFVQKIQLYKAPFLGLCLGMQLLFSHSEEGDTPGLNIIPGWVEKLQTDLVLPHMGWNQLSTGDYAYFMHSYVCRPQDSQVITQTVQYGEPICSGLRYQNFYGLQWHPEKSGATGDRYLLSFARLCQ